MFERLKEKLWRKPEPPPEPVKESEPELQVLTQQELLAHAMHPMRTPRESILIEITKSKLAITPKLFLVEHWPHKRCINHLAAATMLQQAVMVPYRAVKANHGFRMLKVPLQGPWYFRMGTSTWPVPPTERAEMFACIDDPDQELVDPVTHQLTPHGSLLVKRVCLATMSSVMDYHYVNGIVFMQLKPPVVENLYDTISEAAISILGNK